jgi:cytochrome c556
MRSVKLFRIVLAGAVLATFSVALPSEDAPPEHVKAMKSLGENMGKLRKNIDVEENAGAMAETMKEVGAFWKNRNSEVAMKSCKESRDGALAVAKAAKAGDQPGVSAGMKMIGAGCKGCHDTHREKVSDTVYKIK